MSKITKGMFTSLTCEYATPQWLFDKLNKEFRFTLDPCSTIENHKCKNYFTESNDGLTKKWSGRVFMNPPYGNVIKLWIKKAYESVINEDCEVVVCLLPSRTDTKWWHNYCMKSNDIRFIKGRIKFIKNKPAPFPSCIVVFSKEIIKSNRPRCGYEGKCDLRDNEGYCLSKRKCEDKVI